MKIVSETWSSVLEVSEIEVNEEFLKELNDMVFDGCIDTKEKPAIGELDVKAVIDGNTTEKLEQKYLFVNEPFGEKRDCSLFSLITDVLDEYIYELDGKVSKKQYESCENSIEM